MVNLLQTAFEVLEIHLKEMFRRGDESAGEQSGLVLRLVSESLKSFAAVMHELK